MYTNKYEKVKEKQPLSLLKEVDIIKSNNNFHI